MGTANRKRPVQISNVSITIVKPHGGLIGFASLVLAGVFYVGGIAIHEKLTEFFKP